MESRLKIDCGSPYLYAGTWISAPQEGHEGNERIPFCVDIGADEVVCNEVPGDLVQPDTSLDTALAFSAQGNDLGKDGYKVLLWSMDDDLVIATGTGEIVLVTYAVDWGAPATAVALKLTDVYAAATNSARIPMAASDGQFTVTGATPSVTTTATPTDTVGPGGEEQQSVQGFPDPNGCHICHKGDLDFDSDRDLFDLIRLVDVVLDLPPPAVAYEQWAADVDKNGTIDIFDILFLVDHILYYDDGDTPPHAGASVYGDSNSEPNPSCSPECEVYREPLAWIAHKSACNPNPTDPSYQLSRYFTFKHSADNTLIDTSKCPIEVRVVETVEILRRLSNESGPWEPVQSHPPPIVDECAIPLLDIMDEQRWQDLRNTLDTCMADGSASCNYISCTGDIPDGIGAAPVWVPHVVVGLGLSGSDLEKAPPPTIPSEWGENPLLHVHNEIRKQSKYEFYHGVCCDPIGEPVYASMEYEYDAPSFGLFLESFTPIHGSIGLPEEGPPCRLSFVRITEYDICQDVIRTILEPCGVSGPFQLDLLRSDDTEFNLVDEIRSGGWYPDDFNLESLPTGDEGHFDRIRARWTVDGEPTPYVVDYEFKNLGLYKHTAYKTVNENDPTCDQGSNKDVCFTTYPPCADAPEAERPQYYEPGTMKEVFWEFVKQNGSGISKTKGLLQREWICKDPPDGCEGTLFRIGSKDAYCGGEVDANTVAVASNNADGLYMKCGAELCIQGLGRRTVLDKGDPEKFAQRQLDHWIPNQECTELGSPGSAIVIQLSHF